MKYRAIIFISALSISACGLFHKKQAATTPKNPNELAPMLVEMYYEGEHQYQQKNYSEAEIQFQKFVKLSPRPGSGYYRLACIRREEGKPKEALEFSDLAKTFDTANIYTYLLFDADILRKQNDLIRAGNIYAQLAKKNTGKWSLYSDAAYCYDYAGNADLLLDLCRYWEKEFTLREDIATFMRKAYLRKGMKDSAAGVYLALQKKYPERRQYKIAYGRALQDAGRMDEAVKIYDEILLTDPQNEEILEGLCAYYRSKNDKAGQWQNVLKMASVPDLDMTKIQTCIDPFLIPSPENIYFDSLGTLLNNLVRSHPSDSRAWYMLGDWEYTVHQYIPAAEAFAKSVNITSSYDGWTKYITCLNRTKSFDRMLTAADSMRDLFPSVPHGYVFSARAYIGKKDWKNATEQCENALIYSVEKNTRLDVQVLLARILNYSGKPEDAINNLKALLGTQNDRIVKSAIAEIYALNNRETEEALRQINEVLNSNPPLESNTEIADYMAIRALIYMNKNDFASAITDLQKCVSVDPYNADFWYRFGELKMKSGSPAEAKKYYEKALNIAPGFPGLKEKINAL